MSPSPPANNIAFTTPINPPGSQPILTRAQVWAGLLLKIRSAETFIPGGIRSTTVLSTSIDPAGNPVTVRDVVFVGDEQRKVRETVTAYGNCRMDFVQEESGSLIQNVLSEDESGELFLTYVFEWRREPGVKGEELRVLEERERKVGREGVVHSVVTMRELVRRGEI